MELCGDFDVIEQERRDAERLECVLVQALAKTRKVVHSPILRRITRCKKWLKEGQAGGLKRLEAREGWRSRLEGVPGTLLKVMR
jgi:hypothetical protein